MFRCKQSIVLGTTDLSDVEVRGVVTELGKCKEFQGYRYHVLTQNCNSFPEALSQLLLGKALPSWVNKATVTMC